MIESKPMGKKQQNVQDTLSNDYTGVALLVGALMIATAFVFMWLSVTFPLSITVSRMGFHHRLCVLILPA